MVQDQTQWLLAVYERVFLGAVSILTRQDILLQKVTNNNSNNMKIMMVMAKKIKFGTIRYDTMHYLRAPKR